MQNMDAVKQHAMSHVPFPATKAALVTACNESEFSAEDKAEFAAKLTDKTYNSADEVMKDLGGSM